MSSMGVEWEADRDDRNTCGILLKWYKQINMMTEDRFSFNLEYKRKSFLLFIITEDENYIYSEYSKWEFTGSPLRTILINCKTEALRHEDELLFPEIWND